MKDVTDDQRAAFRTEALRPMLAICRERGLERAGDLIEWFLTAEPLAPCTYDEELREAWEQAVNGFDVRHSCHCPAFKGGVCAGRTGRGSCYGV